MFISSTNIALVEVSRLSFSVLKSVQVQQSQELRNLLEQTKIITSNRVENEEDVSSDDSYNTEEECTSDEEETSDIVQVLKSRINCLVELGPTLQQNLLYARKTHVESFYPPVVPFRLSDPAKIYVSLVREKYRNAQDQLVDRLGESNWQRHQIVRERMTKHSEKEVVSVEETDPFAQEKDGLYSIFRPFSTFHDSGIGISVPTHTHHAPSHASFQSSKSEGEGGSKRVPPTPEAVSADKPFRCPFCGQTLHSIKNRVDWKSVARTPLL